MTSTTGSMPWGFDDLLARKYAIMQQQADAGTLQAQSGATVANSSAALDRARTLLLPAESAANVGQVRAQTGLLGEQAKVVAPVAASGIAQNNSAIRLNNANSLTLEQLTKDYDLGQGLARPRSLGIGQSFGFGS